MLLIHPIIRFFGALLLIVAVFLTKSLSGIVLIYSIVLLLVLICHVTFKHLRFVTYVSLPILLALLVLWGWVIDSHQIALPNVNGIEYAFFLWLRIISWSGVLQFLFVPLVEEPSHLVDFLHHVGIKGSFGILVVASIVFLPEMQRRFTQVVDARRAQGNSIRGLKGISDLPTLLIPLISSLIDSATKRAELWSHRGILESGRRVGAGYGFTYSGSQSAILFVLSLISCITAATIR